MSNLKNTLPGSPEIGTACLVTRRRVYIRSGAEYPAVAGGESVVRLSLGRQLVHLLPVTQRTNALTYGVDGSCLICCVRV